MSRKKLKKFAENEERYNVVQPGKAFYENCKGNWKKEHFKNDNPIVLELACGRGEYTTGLAAHHPDKNFIGVDLKGDRLWYGSNVAEKEGLTNVAFLRCHIQNLEQYFASNEISEIWIVHPDPRPKDRDAKRRLTHPRFLNIYKNLLEEGGLMRFKTDSKPLFEYSVETAVRERLFIEDLTFDLYESDLLEEHFGITTRYERKFTAEGHMIHYMRFRFDKPLTEEEEKEKVYGEQVDGGHL
ncbi:tRNA (guanosine(46)-N7)-methyltransferase TrmB [Algivirga pacifica]|uniref:tRNA (guanine-N(7)-)-methyltransferase n=1 Tax=Algivirga pacifica TaxID=1162670 RepID=A0ABP9DP92_9BACT